METTTLFESLRRSIEEFQSDKAKKIALDLIEAQVDPLKVIDEILMPTMQAIGEQFDKLEIFLPELMGSAQAMQSATSVLMEHIKDSSIDSLKKKAKIVLGTVHGDIHEIGKNIVKVMLEVSGFDVVDLGADVPSMQFIEKAEEANADVIALSALMTTTMVSQKEVIELLEALGKRKDYLVIIGGAPTTEKWQKEIGADGWAETAVAAAKVIDKLIENRL
ncbi:MAG: cobalamin B12-binding domain-containing protein [Candidatus Hodarchaeales archaeon]|jgi:corrinoid protein of di/trimethylamine methyltransferase